MQYQWFYDAAGEAGLLDYTRSRVNTTEWLTIDTTGYDAGNRPQGVTYDLDSTIGDLDTPYTFTYDYDEADHITAITLPAMAGMPAETVETYYDERGRPWGTWTPDAPTYVALAAQYHGEIGTVYWRNYGMLDGMFGRGENIEYNGWSLTLRSVETAVVSAGDEFTSYEYDAYNNVEEIHLVGDNLTSANTDTQCFTYDGHNRLREAWGGETRDCDADPWTGGGLAPYHQTYTLNEIDNLTQTTYTDGSTPTVATTYTYPPSGPTSDQPHAPTSIGGLTHTWNDNGQLLNDGTNTYTWNRYQQLTTATNSTTTDTYTYDPAGRRILTSTTTPTGTTTTYYLPNGVELTYDTATSTTTARRHYSLDGRIIAVRDNTGTWRQMRGNHQGSTDLILDAAGNPTRTLYLPYGQQRTTTTSTPTTRQFLGQTHDTTTNLNYLNARYYNPNTGIFLSVDPLVAATEQPYLYANGNPITLSDPTGLCFWDLCIGEAAISTWIIGTLLVAAATTTYVYCNSYECDMSLPAVGSGGTRANPCTDCHSGPSASAVALPMNLPGAQLPATGSALLPCVISGSCNPGSRLNDEEIEALTGYLSATKEPLPAFITDPNSIEGKSVGEVIDMIPESWEQRPASKGDGTVWAAPGRSGSIQIIIEAGWPNAWTDVHAGPYAKIATGTGPSVHIPLVEGPAWAPNSSTNGVRVM